MDIEYIPPQAKYFHCSKCGKTTTKKLTESISGIARCGICQYPAIEHRLKHPAAGIVLTDEQVIKRLPVYTQMKYYWLKNPKSWEDNIKKRETQNLAGGNKKIYMKDNSGHRVGAMPEVVKV